LNKAAWRAYIHAKKIVTDKHMLLTVCDNGVYSGTYSTYTYAK